MNGHVHEIITVTFLFQSDQVGFPNSSDDWHDYMAATSTSNSPKDPAIVKTGNKFTMFNNSVTHTCYYIATLFVVRANCRANPLMTIRLMLLSVTRYKVIFLT